MSQGFWDRLKTSDVTGNLKNRIRQKTEDHFEPMDGVQKDIADKQAKIAQLEKKLEQHRKSKSQLFTTASARGLSGEEVVLLGKNLDDMIESANAELEQVKGELSRLTMKQSN